MLTFASDFANSTLQNSFLVIIDQQKVRFILIFAANFEKNYFIAPNRNGNLQKPTVQFGNIVPLHPILLNQTLQNKFFVDL